MGQRRKEYCVLPLYSSDLCRMACSPKPLPFTYDTPWLSNTSVVDMIPCVINLAKGDSFFLDNLPPCYSYGQPVWCSESLLCMIGWHKTPVHESMDSFCTLPSSLLFYDLNTHTTDLLNLEVAWCLQSWVVIVQSSTRSIQYCKEPTHRFGASSKRSFSQFVVANHSDRCAIQDMETACRPSRNASRGRICRNLLFIASRPAILFRRIISSCFCLSIPLTMKWVICELHSRSEVRLLLHQYVHPKHHFLE